MSLRQVSYWSSVMAALDDVNWSDRLLVLLLGG